MTTANTQDEEQADLVLQTQGDLFLVLKNRYGEFPTTVDARALAELLVQRPTMQICWRPVSVSDPVPEPQVDDAQAFAALEEENLDDQIGRRIHEENGVLADALRSRIREDLREELEVYLGRLVAEQVAALAAKADREAEVERLNFFAARAMEALIVACGTHMPMSDGAREQIAHQAYEMARVMVAQAKRVTKKGPPEL